MSLNFVLPDRLWGILDVKACLMQKGKQKRAQNPWEKSMLSRWAFLVVGSPDCGHYFFGNVDGVGCLG
jgi:hypothetical protein